MTSWKLATATLGAARTLRRPFAPAELRRAVEETLALDSKTPP